MRFLRERNINKLQESLSYLLKGKNLTQWVDSIVDQLLKKSKQGKPPVKIDHKIILNDRRIKGIRYNPNLVERGQLLIGNNGFYIEVNPLGWTKDKWHNLLLAHEISHTFLYNIDEWPPKKIVSYDTGDQSIEWLCFEMAKNLLAPSRLLEQEIKTLQCAGSINCSFAILDRLSKIFLIPWQIVAQRLIEDIKLWNCIILYFYADFKHNMIRESKNIWRLRWQAVPSNITKKLFIPFGKKVDGIKKYPEVKGKLYEFIEKCVGYDEKAIFDTELNYKILNSRATGNLGKILMDLIGSENIKVQCSKTVIPYKRIEFIMIFSI